MSGAKKASDAIGANRAAIAHAGAAASVGDAVDVSVVIPLRDGAATIVEAVDSVLRGGRRPREVLVVDDRSTDGGADLAAARDPMVSVIASEGVGAASARNTGARRARGEWLAFLDADDLWEPQRLECGMNAAAQAPHGAAIYGRIRQFFDPSLGRADSPDPEISDACHPDTLLVRREVFLEEGGFDAASGVASVEVVEWYARRRDAGRPFVFIREPLAARRIHARNWGPRIDRERGNYVAMAKAILDRRRALGVKR